MLDAETIHQLNNSFQEQQLPISLAELQGMIFGYLAIQNEPCFQSWVALCDDLLNWSELKVENQEQIKQLFLVAHMELQQSTPLSIVLAPSAKEPSTTFWQLIDWARGFLYGLGLGTAPKSFYALTEIQEILHDFTAFTQLKIGDEQTLSPEQIQDYQEILGHIQVAVSTVYHTAQREEFDHDEA